ncbi:thioredoxin-like protein YLS8 [Artemisia annua]|uniref:Thioredoxin-like protein YLS8 n=1 Tax=Artemisia annua TaxID=35608 RepID=A0A2U1KID9_ARTAN|nr:thioredoxin-like protein YLS8 [Artemisia annua]
MSYLLPHLHSGWQVDQAILAEEERVVIIRFGNDGNATCMQMDEVLASVANTLKNFAVIYLVDIDEVPDFKIMYELYDPSTVMFFFRNKHIMIDLGTGNNNKINWPIKDKQEFIDIVETVYRGARKGRGLLVENLGEAIENGTRDQHFDSLVTELSSKFEKCQQLLNNISASISSKAACYMPSRIWLSRIETVEGTKQKVAEAEQMLNQRRELVAKYKNSLEELTKSDI